jgi:hypothetical protein
MKMTKLKTKSLTLHSDLAYNQRLGLPVEVFSMKSFQTIAFGKIRLISDKFVCINSQFYSRETHLFFGCPYKHDKHEELAAETICDRD